MQEYQNTDILQNAQGCYEDGQDFPFDGGANNFCREFTDDRGNPYYMGFVEGCMNVQGNTMDVCESETN